MAVPFKKGERRVLECLRSICEMDYPAEKLDVVVVDDWRDDVTARLVRRQFPSIRLLRNRVPLGSDGAKQAVIDAATGDIVALTDADCTVHPRWARVIAKNLSDAADAVTGPVEHPKTYLTELVGVADFQDFQADRHTWVGAFPGCNVAMCRDVLQSVKYQAGSEMRFGSDRLTSWLMHTKGFAIRYDPGMIVCHSPAVDAGSLIERRLRYGRKALTLRRIDGTLPGGLIARVGLLAAPAYVCYKVAKDAWRLLGMAARRRVNPWHVPALFPALVLFRLADAVGLLTSARRRAHSPARREPARPAISK